ncbi:flagellar hook-associated protein FlgK [Diaphorobacter sp. JS3050]|uniref:flagellar hook-associated protein FlgK n=2 Tax=Diaphorobacter TaxID=238749 RepID=UPI001551685B|nr:flagellar hook-associated protein FlgK [Diaphorobacter sp. JS3050]QJY34564.1 flagellar hook-associated protein FlgK [Diaphorobacter sp. JS3050]
MSLLNVGARALLANQVALQTTGHNIANVSTAGYSRQNVAMETVQGQFTGSGYIGNGVQVATILRNHSELLTRQAAAAQAVQAGDTVRAERLGQLQDVFQGGTSGLGAAITDMLNSLADVVASPTDITARTVTLTRMDEMAARMRSSAEQLHEIAYSVNEQLQNDATRINSLAKSIADVNEQIARVKGNGQTPNDLLDKRDQLIRELNQFIQTTQIPADDGTVGVFIGGSQALVLGDKASEVLIAESQQFPGSQLTQLFFKPAGGAPVELNEGMLGGGEVAGLLRFANQDLAEGRNLLGRMALAIGRTMNYQQGMGLTLDGQAGKPLFSEPDKAPGYTSGTAQGFIDFQTPLGTSEFAASDYEVRFTGGPTPTGEVPGQIIRLSDGKTINVANLMASAGTQMDGLTFKFSTAGAVNERVLFKPFASAAANIQALVYSPRDLAVANPINAAMGTSNAGTLQLAQLSATGLHWKDPKYTKTNPPAETVANGLVGDVLRIPPPPEPQVPPIPQITLTYREKESARGFFVSGTDEPPLNIDPPGSYTPGTVIPYVSGKPIQINGWSITLQGTPKDGDTVTVGDAKLSGDWYTRNAGNASALMALRDVKMFDESTLSDGYAGLMAQVGTRTQSAQYAAKLSDSIASNLEASRTAVSGVNLDEEAARLIQYQQAYQASAKMLQIAQNIFDNLIQSMGR